MLNISVTYSKPITTCISDLWWAPGIWWNKIQLLKCKAVLNLKKHVREVNGHSDEKCNEANWQIGWYWGAYSLCWLTCPTIDCGLLFLWHAVWCVCWVVKMSGAHHNDIHMLIDLLHVLRGQKECAIQRLIDLLICRGPPQMWYASSYWCITFARGPPQIWYKRYILVKAY